jgi:hypothetical protein
MSGNDVRDQDIVVLGPVNDDVSSDWKTPQAGTQIIIAAPAHMRMAGKHEKPFGDGIDEAVCNFSAAALLRGPEPDVVSSTSAPGASRCAIRSYGFAPPRGVRVRAALPLRPGPAWILV